MDTNEYQSALSAIRSAVKPFVALAELNTKAEALLNVVNHADELKAEVERLKSAVVEWTSKASDARATEESALADAKGEHEAYKAEYATHRDKLRAEALAIEAECEKRKQDAQATIEEITRNVVGEVNAYQAKAEEERARIGADHLAFIAETKAHRARIEQKTAELQAQLDDMKNRLSPLLA
jgi:hypothetical protein